MDALHIERKIYRDPFVSRERKLVRNIGAYIAETREERRIVSRKSTATDTRLTREGGHTDQYRRNSRLRRGAPSLRLHRRPRNREHRARNMEEKEGKSGAQLMEERNGGSEERGEEKGAHQFPERRNGPLLTTFKLKSGRAEQRR